MKAVVQRAASASVSVDGEVKGSIGSGFLILLGVENGDSETDAKTLASKISGLRIFTDENDKMNLSLLDIGGSALVISNFTLCANVKKGKRPNFINAAQPEAADTLYLYFCRCLREYGIQNVQTGVFGADMSVNLINDGPVTIVIDSKELTPIK